MITSTCNYNKRDDCILSAIYNAMLQNLSVTTTQPEQLSLCIVFVYFQLYLVYNLFFQYISNMGTFQGHALPGTFFITFAIWWTIQITRRKMVCVAKNIEFFNTVTYPCFWFSMEFPFEGIIKILAASAGMIGEGFAASEPIRNGHTDNPEAWHGFYSGDLQHVTMYMFFLFSGVCDVLVSRNVKFIPKGIDYMAVTLAVVVQALLFRFHLHGRDELNKTLHILILYTLLAVIVSLLVEYKYQHNIYAGIARIFFTFLEGTWFYQIGFILYPPLPNMEHWDGDSEESPMLAVILFAWHIVGVIIAMTVLSALTYCLSNKCCNIWKGSKEYKWTKLHDSIDVESLEDSGCLEVEEELLQETCTNDL